LQQALPDEVSGRGSTCEHRCEFMLRQQGRKMDDEMMQHMMQHMQMGKNSMSQCPMMKGMKDMSENNRACPVCEVNC